MSGSDLQYGDVGKLQAGQRAVPIPNGPPAPSGGGPGGGPPLEAPSSSPSGLAPFVTEMPSNRPEEPITAGMEHGPGPGPDALQTLPSDDRAAVLHYLVAQYGNQDALEMLNEMRGTAAAAAGPAAPGPAAAGPSDQGAPVAGTPPTAGGGGSLDAFLVGDDPADTIAQPPVTEAAEPMGPSEPLPVQT